MRAANAQVITIVPLACVSNRPARMRHLTSAWLGPFAERYGLLQSRDYAARGLNLIYVKAADAGRGSLSPQTGGLVGRTG